jgi:biopolymer transport protein ExbD
MKLGFFAVLLFWAGLSVGWGQDGIEDLNVRPPVIANENLEKLGRVVLHLHADGIVTGNDLRVLLADDSIKDYITKSKDEFIAVGKEPVLYLRGEADALFKESRRVIKISSDAGVSRVIFAVYKKPEAIAAATDVESQDRNDVDEVGDELKSKSNDSVTLNYRDPKVMPRVISKEEMDNKGKIELNLRVDGSVTGKDSQVLETDEAIKNYIVKSKDEFITAGKDPIIHLKGVTNPKFNTSRRVITIAIGVGINRVHSSLEMGSVLVAEAPEVPKVKPKHPKEVTEVSEPKLKSLIEQTIKPREDDLGMALPGNGDGIKNEPNAVFIHLNEQGHVFMGKEKTPLDKDTDNREMPLLKAELEKLQAGGEKLAVKVHVEPDTVQQRVIDLLNTFAAVGISNVKVVDLPEDE